ncbi:MAG: GNAT family N-acetyltransferase [Bdellovibrionales bacterium]
MSRSINPAYHTVYWLAACQTMLQICEAHEIIVKAALSLTLRNAEKACALMPWLPRERVELNDGSSVWIGPVNKGRELVQYYAQLPQDTLKERFHRDLVEEEVASLGRQLDSKLIHAVGAYDAENKLIGLAEIIPLRDPAKAEVDFAIHPDAQGRGICGFLVNACFRRCAELGFNTIIAEVESSQKSARLGRYFPQEDRIIDGRDVACRLLFTKHPHIRQELLEQSRVQHQRRLTHLIPVSAPLRQAMVAPSQWAAALVYA